MKTIQERADEYASRAWSALNEEFNEDHTIFENIVSAAFVAGAKSELEELTRWQCPKKQLPETDKEVLVTVDADDHTHDVMKYDQHGWWQKAPGGGWCAAELTPAGWRYIQEI